MNTVDLNETAVMHLMNAVIIQAVKDYKVALKSRDKREAARLEEWFLGEDYKTFTKVDGNYIVQKIKEEQRRKG